MKYFLYLLYALLGLSIAFFLLGLVKPSVSYGHEITVNKPVKEAWAVHKDESKYHLWLEGFKSIELISGEKEAIGSKYKVIVNPGEGQGDFEMIETLVSITANDHVTLHFDSDMMIFDQTTSFLENDGQTTIKTASTVKGKGMLMKSMFAAMGLFGNSFQKQEEKNVEALKVVIENNTTDYYMQPTEVIDVNGASE